jgi:putative membrane protein
VSAAKDLAAGAVAGVVASAAMSAATALAGRFGLVPEAPPQVVVDRTLVTASDEAQEHRKSLARGSHLAFGAGTGMLYALTSDRVPGPPAVKGAVFGLSVWTTSYGTVLPAMGLVPPPSLDMPSRIATMVGVHAIFGATLGAVFARLR